MFQFLFFIHHVQRYKKYKNNINYNIYSQDIERLKLFKELNKRMLKKYIVRKEKIESLFMEVPLYYLMAFLDYASYKESLAAHN